MRKSTSATLLCTVWLVTGLLSWYLSSVLFAYILSPVFIKSIRTINAVADAHLLKSVINMLFVYFSDILLCFLFVFALSLSAGSTKPRLALFVFGATAFRLWALIDITAGHLRHYAGVPPWAVSSLVQGLIPPVLIIPLVSITASKISGCIKAKK